MPTEEFKKLLDRDFARVSARDFVEKVSPLLTELVNHASWAFQRCQTANSGRENEDVAPFVLYRHVIEMVDGLQVLISESCAVAAVPLLRATFEANLGLEYIVTGGPHYATRSLSWLYAYVDRQISAYAKLDPATPEGAGFKKTWDEASLGKYNPPTNLIDEDRKHATVLRSVLDQKEFAAIKAEFAARMSGKGRRKPEWYSLFGGPGNVQQLAKSLAQGHIYEILYRRWSSVIHAGDLSAYMDKTSGGVPAFKGVRYPEYLRDVAAHAANFILHATHLMVQRFRAGEDLRNWYLREIRELYLWLCVKDAQDFVAEPV